ncbi:uncharacterized protein LOC128261143 [Drosophila gunungcola]|uniref:uncharacterized protein LOC128261143 n=1 Tax=Drosophila gunungcola TaxID=103775 RepID=UPI0022E3CEB3|nr:uncharacterized protein LOC128261143 [Drosophila gunungcola]
MSKVFWICFYVSLISAQPMVPNNNCEFFTYSTANYGQTYIGVLRAHRTDIHQFYWEANFTSRGANVDQVDYLNPYPSNEECYANVNSGKPAEMVVEFININGELPMLTGFRLNGVTLCSNQKYEKPRTTARIARSMHVSEILRAPRLGYRQSG